MAINGKIFVLSGPSGSGKTTLYKKLIISPQLKSCLAKNISVTTREPRPGEKDGRDYHFVSPKMFAYKKKAGHFLESQKVFDNQYGTPKKGVADILKTGKSVLLCIDVQGAKVIKRKFPKAVMLFVKAPSMEVLKSRLGARGSENDQVMRLRLQTAKKELAEAKDYDFVFVNRDIDQTFMKMEKTILTEMGRC